MHWAAIFHRQDSETMQTTTSEQLCLELKHMLSYNISLLSSDAWGCALAGQYHLTVLKVIEQIAIGQLASGDFNKRRLSALVTWL